MSFFTLFVIASSIWMGYDAANIGYDKNDVRGLGGMGPAGWVICGLFFWIVAFPLYLVKRPALKAAAEQRRLQMQGFAGALPGAVYAAHAAQAAYGQAPYGAPNPYGAPAYGAPPSPYGAAPQTPYGQPAPQSPYGAAPQSPYGQPAPQAPYGQSAPNPYGAPQPSPYGQAPQAPQPPQPSPYGQAPQPPEAPQPPSPTQAPHAGSSGSMTAGALADGIRQLSELRDRGLLTESEFQARKASLLSKV